MDCRPRSIIPGAAPVRVLDAGGITRPVTDTRGRQVWNLPPPKRTERFFINEANRRRFGAGEITREQATYEVPVYVGVPCERARYLRGQLKRAQNDGN